MPKTIRNVYDKEVSFEKLLEAHRKARRGKREKKKERIIMASEYIDRIVHQWYVQHFIKPYFVPQSINTTYACIEGRGMHKASKDVQKAMKSAKAKWENYYILKMDISNVCEYLFKRIRLIC